jgi:hypothetical protein
VTSETQVSWETQVNQEKMGDLVNTVPLVSLVTLVRAVASVHLVTTETQVILVKRATLVPTDNPELLEIKVQLVNQELKVLKDLKDLKDNHRLDLKALKDVLVQQGMEVS